MLACACIKRLSPPGEHLTLGLAKRQSIGKGTTSGAAAISHRRPERFRHPRLGLLRGHLDNL